MTATLVRSVKINICACDGMWLFVAMMIASFWFLLAISGLFLEVGSDPVRFGQFRVGQLC